MAVGTPAARLDTFLADFNNAWIQFHTGDPGANGTNNTTASVAGRKQITLSAAETNGSNRRRRNSGIIRWDAADVTGSAVLTHYSVHNASTGGTFLISGTLSSSVTVANGTPIEIAQNQLEFAIGNVATT
jgi:hypothetical protein